MTIQLLSGITNRHNLGPIDVIPLVELEKARLLYYGYFSFQFNYTSSSSIGSGTEIFAIEGLDTSYLINNQCVGTANLGITMNSGASTIIYEYPVIYKKSTGIFTLDRPINVAGNTFQQINSGVVPVNMTVYLDVYLGKNNITSNSPLSIPMDFDVDIDVDGVS